MLLSKIHMANLVEINAGKIGLSRGQSEDVKAYSQMLILHHKMADVKVIVLINQLGIPLIELQLPADDLLMLKNLLTSNSNQFDIVFTQEMIKAHKKVIAELKSQYMKLEASQVDIKKLIQELLPKLN